MVQRSSSSSSSSGLIAIVLGILGAIGAGYFVLRGAASTTQAPTPPAGEGATDTQAAAAVDGGRAAEPSQPAREASTTADTAVDARAGEPGATANGAGTTADAASGDDAGARRVGGCDRRYRHCAPGASSQCETDTHFDIANCGLCHFDCRNLPHVVAGATRCQAGVCQIANACESNFADCENGVLDGCEADLRTSASHCGACRNACPAAPNATPSCEAGRCGVACRAGWYDCDHDPSNGCESNAGCAS